MEDIIKKAIEKIKTKKWKNLDEDIIKEKVTEYLTKNPKIKINELNEKSSEFKKIIKFVKQQLHRPYGAFQSDISKRNRLFERLKENINDEEIKREILLTHSSTRERLDFYDELKKELSQYIEGKTILDIGCGLNPLEFDENEIIAVEFNKEDIDLLNEYFKLRNKRSKAILLDLNKKENMEKLKNIKTDTAFAWKLFDILGTKITENIVKSINGCYLIASFSTKTLGNKRMNVPRRVGFQKMLRRLDLGYKTTQIGNEIFYIIELNNVSNDHKMALNPT